MRLRGRKSLEVETYGGRWLEVRPAGGGGGTAVETERGFCLSGKRRTWPGLVVVGSGAGRWARPRQPSGRFRDRRGRGHGGLEPRLPFVHTRSFPSHIPTKHPHKIL